VHQGAAPLRQMIQQFLNVSAKQPVQTTQYFSTDAGSRRVGASPHRTVTLSFALAGLPAPPD
jgi:hypothetical protein